MSDDSQLLRAYVDHSSEQDFKALVDRHLGMVYHAALRQSGGDVHTAQESTQAVFVVLARKASRLLDHPSLAGWLYSTVSYTVLRAQRDERL